MLLVDLRQHGRSEPGEPPHTIAACAADLLGLVASERGIVALAGHSFGGKVVLATRALRPMQQTWVLDASPWPRPDPDASVSSVLAMLARLPRTYARRDDFIAAVVAEGRDPSFAQWLAMNVVPDAGSYTLRIDLAAMHELLADYYKQDLWPGTVDPGGGAVELVIADRASTVSAADRARLESAPRHIHVSHVDAGHWVHIDAPVAIVDLFAAHLP